MKDISQQIIKAQQGKQPKIRSGMAFTKGPLPRGTKALLAGPKAPRLKK